MPETKRPSVASEHRWRFSPLPTAPYSAYGYRMLKGRRPIDQWKSVLFGFLVVLCLAFYWERSMHRIDLFTVALSTTGSGYVRVLEFYQCHGSVGFFGGTAGRALPQGFHYESPEFAEEQKRESWFPPPIAFRSTAGLAVEVAHWVLLLVFLAAWFAWIGWRQRKIRQGSTE